MKKWIKRKIKKFRAVRKVSKQANWSLRKANDELNKAMKIGMKPDRYIKHNCWAMTPAEIERLNKKIEKRKEINNSLSEELMNITGCSKEEAKKHLSRAISFQIPKEKYVHHYLFELSDDELKDYAKVLKKRAVVLAKNNKFFIDQVCVKTGWSKPKAIKEMQKMKKRGISYQKYVQKGVYGYNEDQIKHLVRLINYDKTRIARNKEKYVADIMKETGWSRGKTELEVNRAKANCECSYEDFLGFKMYELTPEEQRTYVTLPVFDRMRIKYNEFRPMKDIFDDKAHFNEVFKKYIKRVWFTNDNLTYEEFEKYIKGLKKVIVKPLAASCGVGVEAFECNKSKKQNKELYDHIISLGKTIVEEYIFQTKEMAQFCTTSVNTVRVFTLNYQGKCVPLYGFFRMGNGGVVDNFHANGLAAGLDVKKGVVETNAVDLARNVYKNSPSTGKKIKGFKIPKWKEIMDICQKASQEVEGCNFIGWDFAITEKGVDLIEGNVAAYYVAQLVNVEEKRGLMPIMVDPYL